MRGATLYREEMASNTQAMEPAMAAITTHVILTMAESTFNIQNSGITISFCIAACTAFHFDVFRANHHET